MARTPRTPRTPRHALPPAPRRNLLRVGLTLTAAGAALGLSGAAAQAAAPAPAANSSAGSGTSASDTDSQLTESGKAAGQALTGALGYAAAGALNPVTSLKLNPLAGTGVDPLDNGLGTQIADFQPISTTPLTDPLTQGSGALKDMPVLGDAVSQVTGLLPG
ncbi:hypothetical protein AB0O07_23545 [Streptomyces sp. NPDC093085]|uniref:hypothetical protein n=1 Tax=Streptomyces sp. NPDC093085 TaxID=3155068 RepID=UPI0034210B0F